MVDLAVHRGQVLLDRVHGLGQHGLFAGQAVHIVAEVADRIAAHDLRQTQLHRDVRGGQRVAVVDHAPVVAGEGAFVHAVADLAGVVALRHFLLRIEHGAQLFLHALQRTEQATQLVIAPVLDAAVQAPVGDRGRDFGGVGQRLDHQALQQQVKPGAEQQRRAQADCDDGPQQRTRLGHQQRARDRHAQREALLRLADLQRHIHFDVAGAGLRIGGLSGHGLALGDAGQQGARGRIVEFLADQRRVAIGDDHPAGRQQAHLALAERTQLGQALLQLVQAEVADHHAQELAVLEHRSGQRGHQHLGAIDLIEIGFDHGGAVLLARLEIPVADAGDVVVAQRLAHLFVALPCPVHHVAAAAVVALCVDIGLVLAVERLRLPHGAHRGPVRVLAQSAQQDVAEGLADLAALVTLHQHAAGDDLVGDESGIHVAGNALRLQARDIGHAVLGRDEQGIAAAHVADRSGHSEAQDGNGGHAEHQAGCDAGGAGEKSLAHGVGRLAEVEGTRIPIRSPALQEGIECRA